MKQITQNRFSREPTPESRGNCHQAAVESILERELAAVPNFHDCQEGFWLGFHNFVKSIGGCVDRASGRSRPQHSLSRLWTKPAGHPAFLRL
jgi:hypothetical protein